MFDIDSWQEMWHSLCNNKLRTALTAFGVFWGILMLIILLGVGKGLQNGSENAFSSDDRSSIWIQSGRTRIPYKNKPLGREIQFTEADLYAIEQTFDEVDIISAENYTGPHWDREVFITHGSKSASYGVYGVARGFFDIKRFQDYRYGRPINELDNTEQRKVAVIGTPVADALFGVGADPIGKHIIVHDISLKVVGVFYDDGQNGRMSERVYIPMSTFQNTYGNHNELDTFAVIPHAGVDPLWLKTALIEFLQQRHVVSPDDRRAIRGFSFAETAQTIEEQAAAVNAFIWFVGIGTLAAGIIGVSNIMIITVKERTREIGVRKALGAQPMSIVRMVLLESVIITAVAGYVGLVLGVGVLELINTVMQQLQIDSQQFERPSVDMGNAFVAIAILVVSGALAGLPPALHAARIMPIEAMREE